MRSRISSLMVAMAACLLAAGCSTTKQARSVTPAEKGDAAILGDYGSLLQEGKDDESLLRYENPAVDWSKYTKAIIAPVKFEKPEDASPGDLEDLQKLADASQGLLIQEMGQVLEIVKEPGPGTFMVESALYNAQKKRTAMNFISGVMPIGMAVNLVTVAIRGKPLSVGELSGEMKVTDASTGQLVLAAVDRRVGRKYQPAEFKYWGEAYDAIEYWAKRARYVTCVRKGLPDCQEP